MFSIVIPSWNNLEYLKLCIESLKKHSKFEHEILVHLYVGMRMQGRNAVISMLLAEVEAHEIAIETRRMWVGLALQLAAL